MGIWMDKNIVTVRGGIHLGHFSTNVFQYISLLKHALNDSINTTFFVYETFYGNPSGAW